MSHAIYSLFLGLFVFGDAQEEACGASPFPCAHFLCCEGVHSSPNSLFAGTLLLFSSVHKQVHLFDLFVPVVLLCVVDVLPSGAEIVGGFLRSKKPIFRFFCLFSVSFSCFFFLFHWRARDCRTLSELIPCPFDGAFLKNRQRAAETLDKNSGVVGFEPRTPSLEYTCLPTRVQSNALMRTAITV